jgi:hypothetical protein
MQDVLTGGSLPRSATMETAVEQSIAQHVPWFRGPKRKPYFVSIHGRETAAGKPREN